jgi:hypothetical protein
VALHRPFRLRLDDFDAFLLDRGVDPPPRRLHLGIAVVGDQRPLGGGEHVARTQTAN